MPEDLKIEKKKQIHKQTNKKTKSSSINGLRNHGK